MKQKPSQRSKSYKFWTLLKKVVNFISILLNCMYAWKRNKNTLRLWGFLNDIFEWMQKWILFKMSVEDLLGLWAFRIWEVIWCLETNICFETRHNWWFRIGLFSMVLKWNRDINHSAWGRSRDRYWWRDLVDIY